jgi:crossover junction endodeoxyribonuclease RuvC
MSIPNVVSDLPSYMILGIDPGSRITGYGIIKVEQQQLSWVIHGCLRLAGPTMAHRLSHLLTELKEVMLLYQPQEMAIEEVFVHKNVSAALKLGQARGVAMATGMLHHLAVYEYAARQVKQAVVGRGNAAKAQVQHMVQAILQLPEAPQTDAADALAIAICHAHVRLTPTAMVRCQKSFARRSASRSTRRWLEDDWKTTRDPN